MAEFNEAFKITVGHEGGYSNHPDDRGGETYRGISRKSHPYWVGWQAIDLQKHREEKINVSDQKVEHFYRVQYWSRINGENIKDQDIANVVFDVAVNAGWKRAGQYLQRVLNALNRQQRDYPDLTVDGKIGPKTIAALNKFLARRSPVILISFYAAQMLSFWLEFAERDERQESFTPGIGQRWANNFIHIADGFHAGGTDFIV